MFFLIYWFVNQIKLTGWSRNPAVNSRLTTKVILKLILVVFGYFSAENFSMLCTNYLTYAVFDRGLYALLATDHGRPHLSICCRMCLTNKWLVKFLTIMKVGPKNKSWENNSVQFRNMDQYCTSDIEYGQIIRQVTIALMVPWFRERKTRIREWF